MRNLTEPTSKRHGAYLIGEHERACSSKKCASSTTTTNHWKSDDEKSDSHGQLEQTRTSKQDKSPVLEEHPTMIQPEEHPDDEGRHAGEPYRSLIPPIVLRTDRPRLWHQEIFFGIDNHDPKTSERRATTPEMQNLTIKV